MPKTKFQEIYFHPYHIRLYNLYHGRFITSLSTPVDFRRYIQSRTAFFSAGMVHRIPLRILHRQQNIQIFRVPRSQTNWPPDLHHPLHPDLHRPHNGTADEPAWNHRIFRNHFKSHLHLAPDHLPELHHSLPTADPGCRTILQIRIPSPCSYQQVRKMKVK